MAAMIQAEVGDFNRFSSPDKILAFAGLSPTTYQSGNFTSSKAKMDKRGSKYLRYALFISAQYVSMWRNVFKVYYQKKRKEGKHYFVDNDSVYEGSFISSGENDDTILSVLGGYSTIEADKGNDYIYFNPSTASSRTMRTILYTDGDGNDTITGYNSTDTISITSTLASSEDLINGGEVSYYYGRGSQITYNADKNDTVNLFGVSLDQITSAEISSGAVKIGFNDGGNLTMLGQSNSHFVLNGSMWTADQSTQTWSQVK